MRGLLSHSLLAYGRKLFEWEPSIERAQEAADWMIGLGFSECYAFRAVGDQLGLSVAQLRDALVAGRDRKSGAGG